MVSIITKFRYRKYKHRKTSNSVEKSYGPFGPYFYSGERNGKTIVFKYLGRSVDEVAESMKISRETAFQLCISSLLRLIEKAKDPDIRSKARVSAQRLISQSKT